MSQQLKQPNSTQNSEAALEKDIAAIDLGSNSFHMVVAKVVGQDLQIVSRHKQRVKLASGLDEHNLLSEESMQRGLDCLAMFSERLEGFKVNNVRMVATHTLRIAKNANQFIQRAQQVLPFPIELIPGEEEARLIYLGVAHTQPVSKNKLVIDIGGGSTELIIGEGFDSELVNSQQMGCVSYAHRYFSDGKLTSNNFTEANLAAQRQLEFLAKQYKQRGWELALGSSGTVKAIRECLISLGFEDGIITSKRLKKLTTHLCEFKRVDKIVIKGILEERLSVLAPGVAILQAILESLDIDELHYSPGALREGVMYEMEKKFTHSDIRMRTAENLALKHRIDVEQANRVRVHAKHFLKQVISDTDLEKNSELVKLLNWAALLHEVGLSLSYRGYHRHSHYLLQHTNMPGFNSEQQRLIATLARYQRKALKLNEMQEFSLYAKNNILDLIKILRLAIVINVSRNDAKANLWQLTIKDGEWILTHTAPEYFTENSLLLLGLEQEQLYWKNAGWTLTLPFPHK
ncbi:exopolyphosphatase [Vibrio halioticoli]|uniref:exopolyphosphatase n=1 Tax=Vibrio halioticoli TaxID=71388 RepID=UPI0003FBE84D|nr:exopolyphosphatase [Vibrio halioticoli]